MQLNLSPENLTILEIGVYQKMEFFAIPENSPQGLGVGVSVGVLVGVGVDVSVGVFVTVGVGVSVGVLVAVFVGVEVGVSVGVLVGVEVGVSVGVFVTVLVGVFVGVSVGVLVGVFVAVAVGVFVAVFVGVDVLVGVGVNVGHFFGRWLLGTHPAVGCGFELRTSLTLACGLADAAEIPNPPSAKMVITMIASTSLPILVPPGS